MVVVVTRFRLRTAWGLLATWIAYKRLERRIGTTPGLLKQSFVFEGLHSALSISIWDSDLSVVRFGAQQPFHVAVGNAVFPRIARMGDGRPELWSIKARPVSLSSNLNWDQLDLRAFCSPLADEDVSDALIK